MDDTCVGSYQRAADITLVAGRLRGYCPVCNREVVPNLARVVPAHKPASKKAGK